MRSQTSSSLCDLRCLCVSKKLRRSRAWVMFLLVPSKELKESVEKWRAKNFRTLLSLIIFRPTFFDRKHCSQF
jgi:hypothetical protein